MMSSLGNKKNVKIFSFIIAGLFIVSIGGVAIVSMGDVANAAPLSNIGVVDQREVISSNSALATDYQTKMQETADEMQKDFDAKSAGMSDADKEKLFTDMQQTFNDKKAAIEKDMETQVTAVVKSVADKKGLTLVVDKMAVIYGGTDITKEVSDALGKAVEAKSGAKSDGASANAGASDGTKADAPKTDAGK